MDGNRDDALRCEVIGKEAMRTQDFSKALKFFQKSLRLYPSDQVSEMTQQAQTALDGKNGNGVDANGVKKRGPRDGRTGSGGPSASASPTPPAASAEHLELVRRVRRSSNYYEILELAKTCTDEDIRKAYRKLSLKVHPDKNKAAGAEEAFKAVSKAFQCLSDPDLRSNYDQFGAEDPQAVARQRQRNAHAERHRQGGYEDGFDPNDIFNAFFGGHGMMHDPVNGRVFRAHFGGPRQARQQSAGGQRGGVHSSTNISPSILGFLQLLPLLAIFLYALLPAAESIYKLQRVEVYQVERTTSGLNIPFYVKPGDFDAQFPVGSNQRRKLDHAVDQDYRETAETRCYHERLQQAQLYRWGEGQKARDLSMPFCKELRRLQRAW